MLVDSIRFYLILFDSIRFHSIRFYSIRAKSGGFFPKQRVLYSAVKQASVTQPRIWWLARGPDECITLFVKSDDSAAGFFFFAQNAAEVSQKSSSWSRACGPELVVPSLWSRSLWSRSLWSRARGPGARGPGAE